MHGGHNDNDDREAALLERFRALRAPPAEEPVRAAGSSNLAHSIGSSSIKQREQEAKDEDEELERIANGLGGGPVYGKAGGGDAAARQDADFARRISSLKGTQHVTHEPDETDNDPEVEAFLARMAAEAPATPPFPSTKQARSTDLEQEARDALRATRDVIDEPPDLHSEGADVDPEETEEEILARALEEASLDKLHDPPEPHEAATSTHPGPPAPMAEPDPFNFPSIPTHIPVGTELPELDHGTEEDARMRLLLGLSGPTSKPTAKLPVAPQDKPHERQAGQGWNLPGYVDERDDDLDSWCCICNSDASVQCLGCDGDLYCLPCWREGHGPGGEQGHKTKRFVWKKKRAMGA